MRAYELFQEQKLGQAVDAALSAVRSAPNDLDARLLLCDLLCFSNQLDRADKQLEVIAQQDGSMMMGITLYRQLVRAEMARRKVFESGRAPECTGPVSETFRLHVLALISRREGSDIEAEELLRRADSLRQGTPGNCDGVAFDDVRDLDDFVAPFLEVLTVTGKYYWVEWSQLASLEFLPPKLLRDLFWRPAELSIRSGPSAQVYVPALYVGSYSHPDESVRVGQKTDWIKLPGGGAFGQGQRELLFDEDSKPILSLRRVAFSDSLGS